MKINQKSINTLRVLSAEMISNSQIGDTRVCYNLASVFFALFKDQYNFFGGKDNVNRDRLVIADTNATPLLYASLHQFGVGLTVSDLRNFGSEKGKTPAMPNSDTEGVDATITSKSQGIATAVGLALASHSISAKFNVQKFNIISNYTYCIATTDCLEEGMSQEAISLAGSLKLSRLIILCAVSKASSGEKVKKKYEAMGWKVVKSGGNNFLTTSLAIKRAKMSNKPCIIFFENKDKDAVSKKILSYHEVEKMKADFGLNGSYRVSNEVSQFCSRSYRRLKVENNKWQKRVVIYKNTHPKLSEDLNEYFVKNKLQLAKKLKTKLDETTNMDDANKIIVNEIKSARPCLMLASIKDRFIPKLDYQNDVNFSKLNNRARNIVFGNRENSMAEIIAGISLYFDAPTYSFVPICIFNQMLSGIEHSAAAGLPVLYGFYQSGSCVNQQKTNIEIYGQIEWLRSLRNINIFKPATSLELLACYNLIYDNEQTSCLIIPQQEYDYVASSFENAKKGAYVLVEDENYEKTLVASGNEVHIAMKVKKLLNDEKINLKIVSAPSISIFENQSEKYRHSIIDETKEKIYVLTTTNNFSINLKEISAITYININNFTNNANEITEELIKTIKDEIKSK